MTVSCNSCKAVFTGSLSADVKKQLTMVKPGLSMLSIFICLKGTKEELKLQSTNYYVYFDIDMDKA